MIEAAGHKAGSPPKARSRATLAARATVMVGALSRSLGLGGGSVIGGRVGLALEPDLVRVLARSRTIALVSGTNGKTTTTRLLCMAMGGPGLVATSIAGANLPSGIAAALASSPTGSVAVLEVDEGHLPAVMDMAHPAVVTLLNLSRDQLDRVSEVRMVAARWRAALSGREGTVVVANCDDPLVAWAARDARRVVWVAAGELWHGDAVGCPACEGRIVFGTQEWSCSCGFERPSPDARLEGDVLVTAEARRIPLELSLPGRFNRANAAMAALSAQVLGVDLASALEAMSAVEEVEGRFSTARVDSATVRLLLAKNPAGWSELLALLAEHPDPLVVAINARVADGHDPSWLWDVPFEQLGTRRRTVATGERCWDLAVRLRHAGVDHVVVPDQVEALLATRASHLDYVGNYTAFQQLRRALRREGSSSQDHLSASKRTAPVSGGMTRRAHRPGGVSALRIVVVHPDLLGTYGDGGNGLVLANRARWRGIEAELFQATSDSPLPSDADVYCLGGGEDGPQVRSAQLLSDGTLHRAVERGAAVLAVCAGFQVIGRSFAGPEGEQHPGVGLLDVETVKGARRRLVGEVVSSPCQGALFEEVRPRIPDLLTGFENHSGVTTLGPGVLPLAKVVSGAGNGAGDMTEGAVAGRVVGTYMHGPVLARNPEFADRLLEVVTGAVMEPVDDAEEERLRRDRLSRPARRRWRAAAPGSPGRVGRTAARALNS